MGYTVQSEPTCLVLSCPVLWRLHLYWPYSCRRQPMKWGRSARSFGPIWSFSSFHWRTSTCSINPNKKDNTWHSSKIKKIYIISNSVVSPYVIRLNMLQTEEFSLHKHRQWTLFHSLFHLTKIMYFIVMSYLWLLLKVFSLDARILSACHCSACNILWTDHWGMQCSYSGPDVNVSKQAPAEFSEAGDTHTHTSMSMKKTHGQVWCKCCAWEAIDMYGHLVRNRQG